MTPAELEAYKTLISSCPILERSQLETDWRQFLKHKVFDYDNPEQVVEYFHKWNAS